MRKRQQRHPVIIIGAGQAGLSVSYYLTQANVEHVVLDRAAEPFAAWRSSRWDSFCLVTPNWTVQLPGPRGSYAGPSPEGFMAKPELLQFFDRWVAGFEPPLRTQVDVRRCCPGAGRLAAERGFVLETSTGPLTADVVVVATATHQQPQVPAIAAALPPALHQIHTSQYRRPAQLPAGPVLVVGAGQSGCQCAMDLLLAGREVYVAVGRCRSLPRRYRGRDVIDWQQRLGLLDRRPADLADLALRFEPGDPQMTGEWRLPAARQSSRHKSPTRRL